jgi:hypothetical protein
MFVSERSRWPDVTLAVPPSLASAEALAGAVRKATGTRPDTRQGLSPLLALGGFHLRPGRLSARGGGIEAALAPLADGRFALTVDTEPRGGWGSVSPELREELDRHRLRFRVAHEIGHSFFYDRSGTRPRRVAPGSAEQERWCDRFASALLLPPSVVVSTPPTPKSLLRLQRRFDVSLHVAVRALARVHRDRFLALLVARGPRPPYVRVQWQKRYGAPAPRWWTDEQLQSALRDGLRSGVLELSYPGGGRLAQWEALPARAQLVVVA